MLGGGATRAAEVKHTRYAVLLARQQLPVAFQTFSLGVAFCCLVLAIASLRDLERLAPWISPHEGLLIKMWRDILSFLGPVSLVAPGVGAAACCAARLIGFD